MEENSLKINTVPMKCTEPLNDIVDYSTSLKLSEDIEFDGEIGGKFKIFADQVIKTGGEAQIFHCLKKDNNTKYAAKIYTSIMPSAAQDKKREKIIRFLLASNKNPEACIMPLVDYGIVYLDDGKYEKQPHYVEIMPFCEGQDLGKSKKIDYEVLVEKVIPNINEALNHLHKENFIHRDVKPENLYWYEGKVVIGDFGITTEVSDYVSNRTTQQRGTLGYSAPELFADTAIKESDYYSLGQTIATLYMGKHMYQNQLLWEDETIKKKEGKRKAVFDNMLTETIFLELESQEHEFLKILIRGLLRYAPSNRFDYSMVKRWMAGDRTVEETLPSKFGETKKKYKKSFNFEGKFNAKTNEELDEILLSSWEPAKEYLYGGKIEKFFEQEDEFLSIHARRVVNDLAPVNENIGLSMFLYELNKKTGLCWYGKRFESFFEIAEVMRTSQQSSIYEELVSSGLLSWHLENSKTSNKNNIKIVKDIENVADKCSKIGFHYAKFKLIENMSFNQYKGCNNIDEIFLNLVSSRRNFFSKGLKLLADPEFYGFMIYLGYKDQSLNLFDAITMDVHKNSNKTQKIINLNTSETNDDDLINLEHLCRYLDVLVADKYQTQFKEFYIKHGPKAYLCWWKDNLDLYNFNGINAKELKNRIKSTSITTNETMVEIDDKFKFLEHLQNEFLSLFHNKLFLSYVGISEDKDKNGITSKALDAFFENKFHGKKIPIGFLENLQK